ncbi:MAG: hypothetical protein Ct9H300mP1_31320 [Planctomycetaceae bacterium]|nr:MAG: hypothetical protein Ct9H300mP1_31320 [Planctomycetaceae bacterium]
MYPTSLPKGLALDRTGLLHGTPEKLVKGRTMTFPGHRPGRGNRQTHFLADRCAGTGGHRIDPVRLCRKGLPGRVEVQTHGKAISLEGRFGTVPQRNLVLDRLTGKVAGTPVNVGTTTVSVEVTDANGQKDRRSLVFPVLPGGACEKSPPTSKPLPSTTGRAPGGASSRNGSPAGRQPP